MMTLPLVAAVTALSLLAGCTRDQSGGPETGGTSDANTAATPPAPGPGTDGRPATAPPEPVRPPQRPRQPGLVGTVSSVVDGDTIKVRARGFETIVRLVGIDTPETRHPSEVVQCFGPAAAREAKRMLPAGRRVRLETDPTQASRDRFGRLLAYVYTPGRSGPRGSVNHALVAGGYARVHIHEGVPFRHAQSFQAAEQRAERAGMGLWGPPCHGDTTMPDPSVAPPRQRTVPPVPPGNCDPNYTGACIPPHPPDLDCGDVPASRFRSVGSDPHLLDGNGDGLACE